MPHAEPAKVNHRVAPKGGSSPSGCLGRVGASHVSEGRVKSSGMSRCTLEAEPQGYHIDQTGDAP